MADFLKHENFAKLILRLALGIFLLFHGISKIMHPQALGFISGLLDNYGLPSFISYGVYIGEVIAPLMIILGFKTRLGAFLIVGNMIFVFMLAHMNELFMLTDHGGWRLELQGFYLFTALAIMLLGSGKYAIQPD